jgi:arginase
MKKFHVPHKQTYFQMSSLRSLPRSVTLISSPYHVGVRSHKVGGGPDFLKTNGLETSLHHLGFEVSHVELGNVDEFEGEIGRSFELIRRTSTAVATALKRGSFPIVLSGNCSASVGVAAGFNAYHYGRQEKIRSDGKDPVCGEQGREESLLTSVWFDAHDDFNTPDTVMSGYFDSQGIAMLGGECWKGLLGSVPGHRPMNLQKQLIHVGMRDVNELERKRVMDANLDVIWGSEHGKVDYVPRLRELLDIKMFGLTMVHLDLDCLDISVGQANQYSAPGGLSEADLLGCFEVITQHTRPVCLTVSSFDPSLKGADNIASVAIAAIVKLIQPLVRTRID